MSIELIKTGVKIGSVIVTGILLALDVIEIFNGKKPQPEPETS